MTQIDDVEYGSPEFDWSILSVQDPMAMVRGQLEFSWLELGARLERLNEDQYRWEPASGTLNMRPRGDARTPRSLGTGAWVAEWPEGPDEPMPRSIAWLIAHLTECFFDRYEWTFGEHSRTREDLDLAGELRLAVAELRRIVEAWINGIRALDPAEVMTVGRSQATPIDKQAPFGHLVLHLNRELIHHGAEISALADLYDALHPTVGVTSEK